MMFREPDLQIDNLHGKHNYQFHIFDANPEDPDLWNHEFSEAVIWAILYDDVVDHPISFDGRYITLPHVLVSIHTNSLNRGMVVSPGEFWKILVGAEQ